MSFWKEFRIPLYFRAVLFVLLSFAIFQSPLRSQEADSSDTPEKVAVQQVGVQDVARDEQIEVRLQKILNATEWFETINVRVNEGIVFLKGKTKNPKSSQWAKEVAEKTQDVVAVVNRIEVVDIDRWGVNSTLFELKKLNASFIKQLPKIIIAFIILIFSFLLAGLCARIFASLTENRIRNGILRRITSRLIGTIICIIGFYLVFRILGLTRLAMTMVGGTGILGLIIGFAFRDIAENFLASILISMQRPFEKDDLIEVAGCKGFIQYMNMRCTVMMTPEGNHVQIPNATIFKSTITNFSANPRLRCDFLVGIGADDSIVKAQEVGLKVLLDHPAIIDDPEPLVLVKELGAATVNMHFFFWIDTKKYSGMKVKSAVIRLVKTAFDEVGISMPDEAREIVFPKGVPVQMISDAEVKQKKIVEQAEKIENIKEDHAVSHSAEGDLASEAEDIQEQAKISRLPEEGEDLLEKKNEK